MTAPMTGRSDSLPPAPTVGRAAETARVLAALRDRPVVLTGEAGIGKTRVLDDVARRVAAEGLTVVRADLDVHDAVRPCGSLLDALGLDPAGPPPLERRASPWEEGVPLQPRLVDAVLAGVEELLDAGDVLLCVDDVHRAEPVTAAALSALVRRTRHHPLHVLLARRPHPTPAGVRALLDDVDRRGGLHADLGPLGERDAWRLARQARPDGDHDLLAAVVEGASGNAFWLTAGAPGPSATDAAVPAGRSLARLLDGLDPTCVRLLRVLALLDGRSEVTLLGAAADWPPEQPDALVRALAPAVDAGLLQVTGETTRLRHDLLSEALVGSLDAVAVARDAVATRLLAAGAPTAVVASQYARAGTSPDPRAVAVLWEAACELRDTSAGAAADLLEQALARCDPLDPTADVVAVELLEACFWSGRLDRLEALEPRVRALGDPALRARVQETLARAMTVLGRPAEAAAYAAEVAAAPEEGAWGPALHAVMTMLALELDHADIRATDALAAAAVSANPVAETLAHCVRSWVANQRGEHERAVEHARSATASADASPRRTAHRMVPSLFLALAQESAGRSADAASAVARGRVLVERLGTAWATPFYHYATALGHWNAGRWGDLLAECDAGLRYARDHRVRLAEAWARSVTAGALLHRGDVAGCDAELTAAEAALAAGGPQFGLDWCLWVRALRLEQAGDRAAAVDLLDLAWAAAEGLHARAALTLFGPDLVRMAWLLGRADRAAAVRDELARDAGPGRANVDAHLARCDALLTGDLALLARARRVHLEGSRPVEVLLDDEAALLLRTGRDDPASRSDLVDLVARCERAGSTLLAERVAEAGRRHGLPVERRRREHDGWDELTPTERRVVELVAGGASNADVAARLGISRRTVESHLYRVYSRVGVRNRTELSVALHARGSGPAGPVTT